MAKKTKRAAKAGAKKKKITGKGRTARKRAGAEYYLLDVGSQQYGDCIFCRFGNKTVLIDGGHSSDFAGQSGYDSIPAQIEQILGHKPPFDLTLLVVTHAHSDHI